MITISNKNVAIREFAAIYLKNKLGSFLAGCSVVFLLFVLILRVGIGVDFVSSLSLGCIVVVALSIFVYSTVYSLYNQKVELVNECIRVLKLNDKSYQVNIEYCNILAVDFDFEDGVIRVFYGKNLFTSRSVIFSTLSAYEFNEVLKFLDDRMFDMHNKILIPKGHTSSFSKRKKEIFKKEYEKFLDRNDLL